MTSRDYFDGVAQQWDGMREDFYSESVRETALDTAQVRPGRLAADVGAGTGFMAEALIRRGLKVIAVDQSREMLAEMRRKFEGVADLEYRQGDSATLPVSDGAVDYVFANMYLHHVDSPPEAIKEMARILKPGGRVVVTDLDAHDFDFLREEHHDRWMGFSRESVDRWFAEAGLTNVGVDAAGEECCAMSSCGDEQASVTIFVASGDK